MLKLIDHTEEVKRDMIKAKSIRLGDIVNFKRGYDLPTYLREEGEYPVISSGGVTGYHSEFKVEGEGVVTGRYGTLGEVHYVNGKYWPHNTTLYVTDFKNNEAKYVYYLLRTLGNLKTSDKSAVPGINRNDLHEVQVPYLPKEYQQKIAKVLSDLDAKIELNNRINAELEAMAKLIYEYWFVQFDFPFDFAQGKPADDTSNPKNVRPYKSSGGKMVWNEELKREVPEGWGSASLLDIAIFDNGLACQKYRPMAGEDSLPVVKIKEMRDGITLSTERVSGRIPDKNKINDGDILFSWSASLEVLQWTCGKAGLNQHIFKVHSKKFPKSFYYMELKSYLKHFKMIAELRKTTMGHITIDHLKQSRIILPPIEKIKELDIILEPIFKQQIVLDKQNQQLSTLRDWLLPMLMNGQVIVTS